MSMFRNRSLIVCFFALYLLFLPASNSARCQTQSASDPTATSGHHAQRTLWIVGDSTANNEWNGGWGQSIAALLNPDQVQVENRAKAGSSSRTFYHEQRWQSVFSSLQAGDWVLIAFGHNDGGPVGSPKYRGSLPGLSDEEQTVELADHSSETVHTYGWYVRRMITDARSKGAHPVLVGVTVRDIWTANHIERVMGQFNEWDRQLAKEEHIPFLDLTDLMADRFEQLGQKEVMPLFPKDHTHNSPEGGRMNAEGVVACLKRLHPWHNKHFYSQAGQQIHPASHAMVAQAH
ncbi:rhamnogalacturonan acetylesterase [Silvibacterium dinghuense]|uniref:Rhamnogalacturonan acetylesterase n=1 Tax=Silvibacterium dinghuense TaxID=1560006 RepID=A0A4Q1S847_9BACT|nr:rhamnogalacturonan acetylesterase [Silvibacterium dinghuense]RXS93023.1 rhamnogalacturonan acetylesterase [Silvibacterium dinghuense]GGG90094.1 hypothetical protein GCM10011586_00630 [Silvibacterium dinghuense]